MQLMHYLNYSRITRTSIFLIYPEMIKWYSCFGSIFWWDDYCFIYWCVSASKIILFEIETDNIHFVPRLCHASSTSGLGSSLYIVLVNSEPLNRTVSYSMSILSSMGPMRVSPRVMLSRRQSYGNWLQVWLVCLAHTLSKFLRGWCVVRYVAVFVSSVTTTIHDIQKQVCFFEHFVILGLSSGEIWDFSVAVYSFSRSARNGTLDSSECPMFSLNWTQILRREFECR